MCCRSPYALCLFSVVLALLPCVQASSISNKLATVAALALQQQAHESVQQGLLASHAAWAKNTAREVRGAETQAHTQLWSDVKMFVHCGPTVG